MAGNLSSVHWMKDAACKGYDLRMFTSFDRATIDAALAVCAGCPVKKPCLIDGFDTPFVRGGTTRYERLMKTWRRIVDVEESNFDW